MTLKELLKYLKSQGEDIAAYHAEKLVQQASHSTSHEGYLDTLVPQEDPQTTSINPIVERNSRAIRVAHEIVMLREQLRDAKAKFSPDDITMVMMPEDGGEVSPATARMGNLAGKIAGILNGQKLSDIMNALCMTKVMTAKEANISKAVLLKNTFDILDEMYDDMEFTGVSKKDLQ